MFGRLKSWVSNFYLTIRAGYYQPADLVHLPNPDDDKDDATRLPRKPGVIAALGAAGVAGALVTEVFMTIASATSLMAVAVSGTVAGLLGAALMGRVYYKCKKAGQELIKDFNAAGQLVSGTRRDIYLLRRAQKKITGLFNDASSPQFIDAEIKLIMDETKEMRARVRVDDPGQAPGHKTYYEFIRPTSQMIDATTPVTVAFAEKAAEKKPPPADLSRRIRRLLKKNVQGQAAA
jgi:hypothetical protein